MKQLGLARFAGYWQLIRDGVRYCGGWWPLVKHVGTRLSEGGLGRLRQSARTLRGIAPTVVRVDSAEVASPSVTDPGLPVGAYDLYRAMRLGMEPHPQYYRNRDELAVAPADNRVNFIAFYLPQFHPIPENDAWWGEGFTEWTNVSKALPQFIGHHQPRLPGALGFYDLRLPETLRKQVALARQYGIGGFCFHYYWFGGRRLLERPLNLFASDREIDFPFCVCWANENWTRRWDGKENDILIGQNHSPEDDLAFLASLLPLFRDSRYIRIGGKPLLIVYRPGLMPDARATAERWRTACRQEGIGEICLVMAQCFGDVDPRPYGFDAAVEFPPHEVAGGSHAIQPSSPLPQLINPEFHGKIYDYGSLIERQRCLPATDYPLFKTVFPSWDNEARKTGAGYIFNGATPAAYRTWLSACCRTALQIPVAEQPTVFINAWNEWAEGAYLEPDRRFGYAYLEATRDVAIEYSARKARQLAATQRWQRTAETAVVLHLFYTELWPEIFAQLRNIHGGFDLYVSLSPYATEADIDRVLADVPDARVFQFENIGRDVYPFVRICSGLEPLGYRFLCKVHSKKSPHRQDGEDWRRAMFDGLLGTPETVERAQQLISSKRGGIIAAPGQIFRTGEFWGSNRARVAELLRHVGVDIEKQSMDFIAGTMFWCAPEALAPLHETPVRYEDFEAELGQQDGTFAHAIERFICIAARARNHAVIEL